MEDILELIKENDIFFVLALVSAIAGLVKWLRRKLGTYLMGEEGQPATAPKSAPATPSPSYEPKKAETSPGGDMLEEFFDEWREDQPEAASHLPKMPEDVRLLAVSPDEVSQRLANRRFRAQERKLEVQEDAFAEEKRPANLLEELNGTLYREGLEGVQKAYVLAEVLAPLHRRKVGPVALSSERFE